MLPPEIISKIRREREERERQRTPAELPLYPPDVPYPQSPLEEEEKTESHHIVVIDMV